MKYGLDIATDGDYCDPRALADLAVEAECAGWDGFFVWDVLFAEGSMDKPIADPWITLSAVAMATSRIRIGAFMTPLARRRPSNVAREVATLDLLSGGRVTFGAGLGYQGFEFTAFGEDDDPRIRAEKLDEGLEVVTRLWTGDPVTYHGKHCHLTDARMLPRPVQTPRPPVWVAGYWPNRKPFQRAARWDGVYVGTLTAQGEELSPEHTRELTAYLKEQRGDRGPLDVAVSGVSEPDPVEGASQVEAYDKAGATWWVELSREELPEMRERIQAGPPRVKP
jgi:alkanesulfonate monooxygenase SsuD/methylene tetrahydromethanopterin reductase-like flavin-dependent oxidoreductase (luciferase family)